MTAQTLPRTHPYNPLPILVLTVLLAALFIPSAHALTRHKSAPMVANSFNGCQGNAPVQLMDPLTGRTAHLCEFAPGQFGRVINEPDGSNITTYANASAKANTLAKAVSNLVRQGFTKIIYIDECLKAEIAAILAGVAGGGE